jgi:hypothetical protein
MSEEGQVEKMSVEQGDNKDGKRERESPISWNVMRLQRVLCASIERALCVKYSVCLRVR